MSRFTPVPAPTRRFLAALLVFGVAGSALTVVRALDPGTASRQPSPVARDGGATARRAAPPGESFLTVSEPVAGGSWIAFSAVGRRGVPGLYLVAPDGSALHRLGEGDAARLDRAWSDDGRSIVFCGRVRAWLPTPANACLEDAGVDPSGLPASHAMTFYDTRAVASPDRRRLAFVRVHDAAPDSAALLTLDLATGRTRVLVEFAANVGLDIDWSPDGSTLAYTAAPPGAARNLWLVGADGGPPRRLTDRPAGREAYSPTWSPDGDWLAFGEAGAGAPRLVRVRADGTGLSVLAELPGLAPRGLDWSPERPHR